MNDELQTAATPRHYDIGDVQRLRLDAELYNVDFSRARITLGDGKHTVTFGKPLVTVDKYLNGKLPDKFTHASALQVEGHMLDQLIRLHRAERHACRIGIVYGWSTEQINRRPLSADEIAEYKSRIRHAATVAELQQQLQEAVQAQAHRAKQAQESIDLAGRYHVSKLSPDETTADVLAAALISGSPKPPRRARQRQQVNHE